MSQPSTRLARFRADPARVRVALRRFGEGWCASVQSRTGSARYSSSDPDPWEALQKALRLADHLSGVDLDMSWAYDHPHP